jgi:hypothetical protein
LERPEVLQRVLQLDLHLLLVHFPPEPTWLEALAKTREALNRKNIPTVAVSDEPDPVKRLLEVEDFYDAVVATSAVLENPDYQISRLARPADLHASSTITLPAGVVEGIALFNAEKFHEAHDAIEPIWLKEPRGVRLLYQGLLQIGIAFYFIEKRN